MRLILLKLAAVLFCYSTWSMGLSQEVLQSTNDTLLMGLSRQLLQSTNITLPACVSGCTNLGSACKSKCTFQIKGKVTLCGNPVQGVKCSACDVDSPSVCISIATAPPTDFTGAYSMTFSQLIWDPTTPPINALPDIRVTCSKSGPATGPPGGTFSWTAVSPVYGNSLALPLIVDFQL